MLPALRGSLCLLGLTPLLGLAADPPRVTHDCTLVNPLPRPCDNKISITIHSTIYFEVAVPSTNAAASRVDPNSVTATLTWPGGGPVRMLDLGQTFTPGFGGSITDSFTDGGLTGFGFYIVPASPLLPQTTYTIQVDAKTLDAIPIQTAGSTWSFTTRRDLIGSQINFTIDTALAAPAWQGRFLAGTIKPNFDTSTLFDQEPVYDLIDEAKQDAPEFMYLQRDWPLMADYWSGGGFFDGNPNLVRERETRRILSMAAAGADDALTLADLVEGPLYGIAPNRPLSADYQVGDKVLVCDRNKSEQATVKGINDATKRLTISRLVNRPASWQFDYFGSQPSDNPATPDNFSYPLGAVRKYQPSGTPVFYWTRLDHEWDQHLAHGRQPIVNIEGTPYDLCRIGRGNTSFGNSCPDRPKDYLEWHIVIKALVDHLVDRYGTQVAGWYWSIGNEEDLSTFWEGTDNEFLQFYDYTANAILHALEQRGINTNTVRVGGAEVTGIFPGFITQILYHASPTAVSPSPGFEERNHVCIDPAFVTQRASRVHALCAANADKGTPLDFISTHAYKNAADSANTLIDARNRSLSIDPVTFDRLPVNSHETTPDWIPRRDPGSREMYRWGGYFSTWAADFQRRMLEYGLSDSRRRAGEVTITTWPGNYNFDGIASIVGQFRIDTDGDGTQDRVDAYAVPFFHLAKLAASMSKQARPLVPQTDAGVTVSGWRSVEPHGEKLLIYTHDPQDTESRETHGWSLALQLSQLRFPLYEVLEYRVDHNHPAVAALDAIPRRGSNGVYTPAEVATFGDLTLLQPTGPGTLLTPTAGAATILTSLTSQGFVFLDLRRPDPDGDGVFDPDDCASQDPSAFAVPVEVDGVSFAADHMTLSWISLSTQAGPGTVYDVYREAAQPVAAGQASGSVCLVIGTSNSSAADPGAPLPGFGSRYLVRGRNACGAGSWGADSQSISRVISACP